MKTAVIGPGAMGLLYGAKLSQVAEIVLIGNNEKHTEQINENGITIKRDNNSCHYPVKAFLGGSYKEKVNLIIMFTKAYLTEEALLQNKEIIGKDTVILTLQNGAGHENVLRKFTDDEHILIGTTQQGSYRENAYTIVNSGLGETAIGSLSPKFPNKEKYCELFKRGGFPCIYNDDIYKMIWNKLMINASSSVLSGVLQVNQGYIAENTDAWEMCKKLIGEICDTASAAGYDFDKEEQYRRIYEHLKNAPTGYTSIYADLKNGRKTEVDYISGTVARIAADNGINVPYQKEIIEKVHCMERG
ncbi:MAG: ketopantoate reductase family protein [Firmicutes bacterium]|nr:ketopantoate reductase family protein [Bacillota bacterium]